jgi:thiol-disulfide isomerase/thioredoxin
VDVEAEDSITAAQDVNSTSYLGLHNAQIYKDGLSFSGSERDKIWISRGPGKGFADLSDLSGADDPNDGRAVVAADFDDDGDVDLFVHNIQRERHKLFRNDAVTPGGPTSGFLKLKLRGTRLAHEAIGAVVIVTGPHGPSAQVLSRGAGFASCQSDELVFGLGALDEAQVDVVWPGGHRESFGMLPTGARQVLVEGAGTGEPYAAHPRPLPDPLPPGLLLEEGDMLPALTLFDAQGNEAVLDPRKLADGHTLFLNLWASYCAPCVAEIPDLQALQDGDEARVVGVSVDAPASREAAARVLEKRGGRYPSFYLGTGGTGLEVLVDLERLPIPTTLVITPEGRIDTILRGPLER